MKKSGILIALLMLALLIPVTVANGAISTVTIYTDGDVFELGAEVSATIYITQGTGAEAFNVIWYNATGQPVFSENLETIGGNSEAWISVYYTPLMTGMYRLWAGDGTNDEMYFNVTDTPVALVADAGSDMDAIANWTVVQFDGSNSGGTITSYIWDFGDGYTGNGSRPTHIYTIPGEYIATLNTTDFIGYQEDSIVVRVLDEEHIGFVNIDNNVTTNVEVNTTVDIGNISVVIDNSTFHLYPNSTIISSLILDNVTINGTLGNDTRGDGFVTDGDVELDLVEGYNLVGWMRERVLVEDVFALDSRIALITIHRDGEYTTFLPNHSDGIYIEQGEGFFIYVTESLTLTLNFAGQTSTGVGSTVALGALGAVVMGCIGMVGVAVAVVWKKKLFL